MSDTPSTKTGKPAPPDMNKLKKDVRAIRDDVGSLASTTAEIAEDELSKQATHVKNFSQDLAERTGSYRDIVVQKVKDHPLAAVGVAALAGVVVASLHRK